MSELLVDLKGIRGLELDLNIDKVENIINKVQSDDSLKTENTLKALKEVLSNYVWRSWLPVGAAGVFDNKITKMLSIVKNWIKLDNLENVHKQLSPMRMYEFLLKFLLFIG